MNTLARYLTKIFFLQTSLFLIASNAPSQSPKTTSAPKSQWAYITSNGKLAYKRLAAGDRIMDFSFAGYMGGGVRIPSPPVKITIGPLEGDNTDAVQKAIDEVSKMKLVNG